MRSLVWIAFVTATLLSSCNYDEGACWSPAEDDGQTGVGGGPIVPGGGGFGETSPEPTPQGAEPSPPNCGSQQQECRSGGVTSLAGKETIAYCSGACAAKCPPGGVSGFSPSVFKFKTIIPDDGKDEGGGYQAAVATLSYFRWTSILPEQWSCGLTVGMPLRTLANGTVSAAQAATYAADVASTASFTLMSSKPELPQGIFCSKLIYTMRDLFKAKYPGLGATVTL